MNVGQLKTEIRFITNTNTGTFSDTDILNGLNINQGELLMEILSAQNYQNIQGDIVSTDLISVSGLVSGQNGYHGEYAFPTDLLTPVKMEISYDGVNWYKAELYGVNQNKNAEATQTDINNAFSATSPKVEFFRNSYRIMPLPTTTVVKGIRIWYTKRQADLTGDSDTPILEPNFHRLYALMGALRYATKYPNKYNQLWEKEAGLLKMRVLEFYSHQVKTPLVMTPRRESFR